MSNLRLALEQCLAGRSWLYSITGPPGIGKTRLAEELASYADQRGVQVAWGRCSTFEVPPAWAWTQIARSLTNDKTATENISELIQNIANCSTSERFKILHRIHELLVNLAHSNPLLIILDDLQDADESCLLILSFLARELLYARIMMVLIFRETDRYCCGSTGRLFRDIALRVTNRISLGKLLYHDTVHLIAQAVEREPEKVLAEAIYRKTGGNPLLTEIALRFGIIDWRKREIRRASEILRPAIERFLSAVSADAKNLLLLCSLIGNEFEYAVVRAAWSLRAEQLLNLLAEAELAGVLQRLDGRTHGYRFVSEFVREGLSDSMSNGTRARLHGQIAEALEGLYHHGVEIEVVDIADHYIQGATVGHAAKALQYCRRAVSDSTQSSERLQEASRFCQAVLSALTVSSSFEERLDDDRAEMPAERVRTSEAILLAPEDGEGRSDEGAPGETAREREERSAFKDERSLERNVVVGYAGEPSRNGLRFHLDEIQLSPGSVVGHSEEEDRNQGKPSNDRSDIRSFDGGTVGLGEKVLRREGEYWTAAYEGKVIRLRHCKGLTYVAYLIANAGHQFHVLDLCALSEANGERPVATVTDPDLPTGTLGDAGPQIDSLAKLSYRQRLQELREDLREARSFNDLGRIANIQNEIEFISRELTRAMGLGGRDRRASSETERARLRVTMAIRSCLKKVAKQHPPLGRHLAHSIHTGSVCSFEPELYPSDSWQCSF